MLEYEHLVRRVIHSPYLALHTCMIDGIQYILSMQNTSVMTHRWEFWIITEASGVSTFFFGNTVKEVFQQAQEQGFPVDQLTVDQFHA